MFQAYKHPLTFTPRHKQPTPHLWTTCDSSKKSDSRKTIASSFRVGTQRTDSSQPAHARPRPKQVTFRHTPSQLPDAEEQPKTDQSCESVVTSRVVLDSVCRGPVSSTVTRCPLTGIQFVTPSTRNRADHVVVSDTNCSPAAVYTCETVCSGYPAPGSAVPRTGDPSPKSHSNHTGTTSIVTARPNTFVDKYCTEASVKKIVSILINTCPPGG